MTNSITTAQDLDVLRREGQRVLVVAFTPDEIAALTAEELTMLLQVHSDLTGDLSAVES